jgi:hypothetical protein
MLDRVSLPLKFFSHVGDDVLVPIEKLQTIRAMIDRALALVVASIWIVSMNTCIRINQGTIVIGKKYSTNLSVSERMRSFN